VLASLDNLLPKAYRSFRDSVKTSSVVLEQAAAEIIPFRSLSRLFHYWVQILRAWMHGSL
jgi:hypothetical protein